MLLASCLQCKANIACLSPMFSIISSNRHSVVSPGLCCIPASSWSPLWYCSMTFGLTANSQATSHRRCSSVGGHSGRKAPDYKRSNPHPPRLHPHLHPPLCPLPRPSLSGHTPPWPWHTAPAARRGKKNLRAGLYNTGEGSHNKVIVRTVQKEQTCESATPLYTPTS